jgi:hypothetical protein
MEIIVENAAPLHAANGKIEFDPLIEQIGLDLATFSPS